jgi:hypothetical protein
MTNPWIQHVQAFRKQHPQLSYKDCLKQAKCTYKCKPCKPCKKTKKGKQKGEGLLDLLLPPVPFMNPVNWYNAGKIMTEPTRDTKEYGDQQRRLLKTLTGF